MPNSTTSVTWVKTHLPLHFILALATFLYGLGSSEPLVRAQSNVTGNAVSVRQGELVVPTYTFGESADTAPLFEIGNAKGLYPYAPLDRDTLKAAPEPINYQSITMENEYLRIVILPELGGRIWSAWDKKAQRNLFYSDTVIKPSAYNQRGGWPVGNLEVYGPYDAHMLTWPGEPWPWTIRHDPDGSATVIVSHIDHFFRNKLFMEVTLRPGRSFVELTLRLHNRNQLPNRYLLWTNAGIPATDGTRFIYPMTKTIGHDTEDYGSWPVFRGVDLSWYRNNPAMLGVFGLDVYDNFIAAYDYTEDSGTICTTNRQVARGIKTWTWGTGQTGLRHTESYTDSGLPYIEVQSGRFVWDGNYEFIEPGKSDGWTEFWYGSGGLGGLTTATRDVAVRLEGDPGGVQIDVSPTGDFPDAVLYWSLDGKEDFSRQPVPLKVGEAAHRRIPFETLEHPKSIRLRLESGEAVLLDYTYALDGQPPQGDFAADAIPRNFGPSDSLSLEELLLKGLTEEKLGRAARAEAVYREALDRDPSFVAPNLRLGLLALSRFQDEEALDYFNRALERDPSNSELHYLLGVTLSRLGRDDEARHHFYRLVPSSGKFDQRDYCLGLLALREGDYSLALELLTSAADQLPQESSVQQAYAYALRKRSKPTPAEAAISRLRAADPTSAFAAAEEGFWASWPEPQRKALDQSAAAHPQGYLELATDYMRLGAWNEVEFLTQRGIQVGSANDGAPYPVLFYYRANALEKLGRLDEARTVLASAAQSDLNIDFFPFRHETVNVLRASLELAAQDSNAASLLGDLLYSRERHDEAIRMWETAAGWNPSHFSSLRNLGWALLAKGDVNRAADFLERATRVRPEHLETATSLTELYARLGQTERALSVIGRLSESRPENDQVLELSARIRALAGDIDGSLQLLEGHKFGIRHQSYDLLHLYQGVQLLKSLQAFEQGSATEALSHIDAAAHVPANLGIDDFAALASSRLLAFRALVFAADGNLDESLKAWADAARTSDQDFDSEGLFRAIALTHIGQDAEAEEWLSEFERVNPVRQADNDSKVRIRAAYLGGIYSIFRGNPAEGLDQLNRALQSDASDPMVRHAIDALKAGLFKGLRTPQGDTSN